MVVKPHRWGQRDVTTRRPMAWARARGGCVRAARASRAPPPPRTPVRRTIATPLAIFTSECVFLNWSAREKHPCQVEVIVRALDQPAMVSPFFISKPVFGILKGIFLTSFPMRGIAK